MKTKKKNIRKTKPISEQKTETYTVKRKTKTEKMPKTKATWVSKRGC